MKIQNLLLCVVLSFVACGKDSKQVVSLEEKTQKVQKMLDEKNLPFKVLEITDMGHSLDLITVKADNGTQEMLFSTSDGEVFMLVDSIIYSTDKELLSNIESKRENLAKASKEILDSALKEVLQGYKERAIHFSAKSPTNKRLIIISDPTCVYCAKELQELDKRLEQYNVEMYLVAFIGPDAANRASYIMENKSDDEVKNKTLLQNAYNKDFDVGGGRDSLAKEVVDFSGVLVDSGVRGVPYIIEVE